jgi:hypothetical protein
MKGGRYYNINTIVAYEKVREIEKNQWTRIIRLLYPRLVNMFWRLHKVAQYPGIFPYGPTRGH